MHVTSNNLKAFTAEARRRRVNQC